MHPELEPPAGDKPRSPYLALTLDSSVLSVRTALAELRTVIGRLRISDDAASSIELVLAEVLTNICKHAYKGLPGGRIDLTAWADGDTLRFETHDFGVPMPDQQLPAGIPASLDGPVEKMPEGGFGWLLIRQLTVDLSYAREGDRNRLSFRMPCGAEKANFEAS